MNYYSPITDQVLTTLIPGWMIPLSLHEPPDDSNSSIRDGVQIAWDNTSIGLFKTCPRKYYYSIVQGYQPRIMAPPLAFGIHLHTLLQTWHKLVDSGTDRHTAFLRIARLAGLLGETIPPGDNTRTKETLVRTIVWYLDQFWDDKTISIKLPSGQPAVEYHFKLPLMEYLGHEVLLCGHLDRMVRWQGKAYVMDYKTTKYALDHRFIAQFKPSTQMPLYVTACHIIAETLQDLPPASGVIIDGIQLGVNFSRFNRTVVEFSLEEINEYIESLKHWIKLAMEAGRCQNFPPNEESCQKYSGCHFREICAKPPARRQAFLEGNYVKRVWNPLQSRN